MMERNNSSGASDPFKKRLFVAIGIPQEIRQELERLQDALKPFARDAKWVRVEGIHLTLKFLGYVGARRIESIVQGLEDVAAMHVPVSIDVRSCGFFPNERRPKVLWVGVGAYELVPVQSSIEEAMFRLGFEKENRAFSPHLTLARFRDTRGRLPLVQESRKYQDTELGRFTSSRFVLYESILRPQGARYVELKNFLLKG